jgi:hypothetical protein
LDVSDKPRTREAWVRRAARRQGLEICKSRQRDPRGLLHGRWWIVTAAGDVAGAGKVGDPPGLTLEEVEEYLGKGEDQK